MLLGGMIARKRISQDGTGRIIGAIAVGNRPLHDRADTLTDPPGGLGNDEPDGGENIHEIRGRERGHRNTAKAGERVLLQRSDPDGGLARMGPLGAMQLEHAVGGLGKGGSLCATARGERIATGTHDAQILESRIARHRQGHHRVRADAKRAAAPADGYTLLPVSPTGRLDTQDETIPIDVLAGAANGLHELGGDPNLGHSR